jgi:heat shock protein HslJ
MKTNQIIFMSFLLFTATFSCKQSEIIETATPISTISGKWKLIEIFKGDVIDSPCGINPPTRDITLEFTANPSGMDDLLSLSGQSTVNEYFGNYKADSKGAIKITTLGGTKRGGSPEMMQCENNYYALLAASEAYKIVQIQTNPVKTVLQLGIFRDNPKDKGAYLIFEKVN